MVADGEGTNKSVVSRLGLSVRDVVVCTDHALHRLGFCLAKHVGWLKQFVSELNGVFKASGRTSRRAKLRRAGLCPKKLFFPSTRWGLLADFIAYLLEDDARNFMALREVCMEIQISRSPAERETGRLPHLLHFLGAAHVVHLTTFPEEDDRERMQLTKASLALFRSVDVVTTGMGEVIRGVEGSDYKLEKANNVLIFVARIRRLASEGGMAGIANEYKEAGISDEHAGPLLAGLRAACIATLNSWDNERTGYFVHFNKIVSVLGLANPLESTENVKKAEDDLSCFPWLINTASQREQFITGHGKIQWLIEKKHIDTFHPKAKVGASWRGFRDAAKKHYTDQGEHVPPDVQLYLEVMCTVAGLKIVSAGMERCFSVMSHMVANPRESSRSIRGLEEALLMRCNRHLVGHWMQGIVERSPLNEKE